MIIKYFHIHLFVHQSYKKFFYQINNHRKLLFYIKDFPIFHQMNNEDSMNQNVANSMVVVYLYQNLLVDFIQKMMNIY
jgi:hypothetical protein